MIPFFSRTKIYTRKNGCTDTKVEIVSFTLRQRCGTVEQEISHVPLHVGGHSKGRPQRYD